MGTTKETFKWYVGGKIREIKATSIEEAQRIVNGLRAEIKNENAGAPIKGDIRTMTETGVWHISSKGSYAAVDKSTNMLPPGEYSHAEDSTGTLWCKPGKALSDTLIELPDLPTEYLLNQAKTFWASRDNYAKYGFLQKRGALMYGPPGCGKTSIINLLKRQIISIGGVVFTVGGSFDTLINGLKEFRKIEPDRPVMTVVEDLETYLESSNGSNIAREETSALALYDGEDQINNVFHLATTNKPDAIADRFIRRPGRFDIVIAVYSPTKAARTAYLKAVCGDNLSETDLNHIVEHTKGLSLAYMREIATTYLVLGIPLEETIGRLKKNFKDKFQAKEGYGLGFLEEKNAE
jgi:hypothetical protein